MVGGQAQEEIGIDDLSLVAQLLLLREGGERGAGRRAAPGKGECAGAVGNAAIPVEVGAPLLAESRNNLAQLRVNRAAVVALVPRRE
jgi:hypothetical protein